jgi:mono/diheme cytochrome c family protein
MMLKSLMGAGFVLAMAAAGAGGQRSTVDVSPSLANPSLVGADTYAFYCAPCHGKDGKGRGPVAEALKTLPADLTKLSARNGGTFPKDRVRAFVTNGEQNAVPAHGTSAMPVWGPTFRALDPNDKVVSVRIFNVVGYLESIQK